MKRLLFAILSLFAVNGGATDYYAASGNPATGAALSSAVMRAEFTSIAAGFAKIAPYTANANKLIAINSGATGQTAITTGTGILTALGINVGSAGAPVLFNGAGGTPSSLTLTNATGLPISGIASLGTGVGTALAVNVGSAGAFVTNGGALGTPSSGVATNLTGTAASLTAGLAQGLTGTPSITVNAISATSISAFQLTGNITNSGNPSINIGSGALTAGPISGTTLSASGSIAVTAAADGAGGSITSAGSTALSLATTGASGGNYRNWRILTNQDALGDVTFRVGASEGAAPSVTVMQLTKAGTVVIPNLSGTGNRAVYADSTGQLRIGP